MGVFLEGLPLYGCVFRGFTPVLVCFKRVYPCMGVFLEGLPLYGCVFRGFTPVWVCF